MGENITPVRDLSPPKKQSVRSFEVSSPEVHRGEGTDLIAQKTKTHFFYLYLF